MDQNPLVSIIIPCYNQGAFLEQAILSVMAQTYSNWECIIINDGSSDGTHEIATRWCSMDHRITYHRKVNGGPSTSRNEGVKKAKGAYIQLLDCDDLIEKEKLEKTMLAYRNVPPNSIIFSSSRFFEDTSLAKLSVLGKSFLVSNIDLNLDDTSETQLHLIRRRNICVVSAPIYPIHAFQKVNYFDEELRALEDWDFNLRCISAGYKFHYMHISNGRTLIRLHSTSATNDTSLMNMNQERFNNKHQVFEIKTPAKQSKMERAVRNILPPAFFKIIPKVKSLFAP